MRMEKQKSDCTTYEKFMLGLQIIDFVYIDRLIHILSIDIKQKCALAATNICCFYLGLPPWRA